MKRWLVLIVACGIPMWSAPAWCGWKTFTTADGLRNNVVFSMLEDRSGNLWLGTSGGGVTRYDGFSWKTFTAANGLAGDTVICMLEDRTGNLWFGTSTGLSRYDGSAWKTFTTADSLGGNIVRSMLGDSAGNLWFGTYGGGVTRYDGSTWRTFTAANTANGLGNDYVFAVVEDRSGNLWFSTYGAGVTRYDGSAWTPFRAAPCALASDFVISMIVDRTGNLWCGTDGGGVSRYDGSPCWTTFPTVNPFVYSMVEDGSGRMWLGTRGGVTRYDASARRDFTTAEGLGSSTVYCMLEDKSGNLWFGTANGVSRYDNSSWKTFSQTDGIAGNPVGTYQVPSILEDHSGNIWFGTYGGGVTRYDGGSSWEVFNTANTGNGLLSNYVNPMLEDRSGNLWVGTEGGGVSLYDGSSWMTFTTYSSGLLDNRVRSIMEDHSGNYWFGTPVGASRYDGSSWQPFTGLGDDDVESMLEDHLGNLWFGTGGGAIRYDGSVWSTFTTDSGLASNEVETLRETRSGDVWDLWFGTPAGVSRFDGSAWTTFTSNDGLGTNEVVQIRQDRSGNLWFGTRFGGVTRYDGSTWRTFGTTDGLGGNTIYSILEDRAGNLWFGTNGGFGANGGATRYEPDRVPTQTIFVSAPPRLTAARNHNAVFAAFGETERIEFSYRLDSSDTLAWSPWAATNSWFANGLPDGTHQLEVRSRDFLTNTDASPAKAIFEIDATPPAPVIASPTFSQPVRGETAIRGYSADARFRNYRVETRRSAAASWDSLLQSSTPVTDDTLATWDTSNLPDGNYDIRLSVADSLGLVGIAQITVAVDNHAPFVDVTTPARVAAATGGDVYTTNAEAHLYFPPHAFAGDALVTVSALADTLVPANLPSGAPRVLSGYEIGWGGLVLGKPARLALSYAGAAGSGRALASAGATSATPGVIASGTALAVYRSSNGTVWERLGGTVDVDVSSIELAVTQPGRYALFAESSVITGTGTLAGLAFTPRVFSPTGTFADRQVGISFALGRAAPVTVRVYSRSGRLIREVVAGETMNAGANLVRWDGRDRNGGYAADGMYLVTVEALGQTERKTLAVVK